MEGEICVDVVVVAVPVIAVFPPLT